MIKEKIKAGYKSSPLGLIPIDWEVKTLRECCLIKGEYGINAAAVDYSKELPTYIRITDIDEDGNYSAIKKASVDDINSIKFILQKDDILFARTGATVGKTYLYKESDGNLIFAGFLIRFRTNEKQLLSKYLKYFTLSKPYWDWVKTVSRRSGQPGINAEEYGLLKLPLPSISDQKVITNLLSHWDDAIEATKRLIDYKTDRKKWLMQKLLTGKKKLKGFENEKWKEVRLGDITRNFSRRNKEIEDAKVYSVTNSNGFVLQSEHFSREIAGDDLSNYKIIRKHEFAYNPARINVGSIAYFENEIGIISSLYVCFSTTKDVEDFFLQEVLKLDHTKHKIGTYGEGGVRIYLWYDLFKKIKIALPGVENQKMICKVLKHSDKEIELLQNKRDLLKEQKKGLMQVLLTGKKRLKTK